MSAFLDCLGASGEVGRSAFLLHTDKKIMLDYGIKIFDKSGKPHYPLDCDVATDASVTNMSRTSKCSRHRIAGHLENDTQPNFAIITHAHLDHSGFVPALYKKTKIRWYATPPTRELCNVLWQDSMKIMGDELPYHNSHFKKSMKYWNPILYGQPIQSGETTVTMLDAGHICGAAMVLIEYGNKRMLYTGDFKCEETYMHKGAGNVEDIDVLIIESTYAMREHPTRRKLEERFMEEIRETIEAGGNVLLPAFALGITQELLPMIRKHFRDIPFFVDGMGKEITKIYLNYQKYLKDAKQLKKAVKSVNMVREPWQRREATKQPGIILTSAGMMSGGPVLNYIQRLLPESKVIFTGYNIEGTNGWKLLNNGEITINGKDLKIDLPVEYLDFSAHAGRNEILNFIKHANPEKIVLVHGDDTKAFEKELREDFGYDAIAPVLGDRVVLY